jgi:hypothetical protein
VDARARGDQVVLYEQMSVTWRSCGAEAGVVGEGQYINYIIKKEGVQG